MILSNIKSEALGAGADRIEVDAVTIELRIRKPNGPSDLGEARLEVKSVERLGRALIITPNRARPSVITIADTDEIGHAMAQLCGIPVVGGERRGALPTAQQYLPTVGCPARRTFVAVPQGHIFGMRRRGEHVRLYSRHGDTAFPLDLHTGVRVPPESPVILFRQPSITGETGDFDCVPDGHVFAIELPGACRVCVRREGYAITLDGLKIWNVLDDTAVLIMEQPTRMRTSQPSEDE